MMPSFSANPGVAAAALRGLTLRVQSRPGAPTEDDPLASTTVVDGLGGDMEELAEGDAMAMLGEDEPDDASDFSQIDATNRGTVNKTAFLENNYPLAVGRAPADAGASFGAPLQGGGMGGMDPAMLAAMMGGGAPADPRRRGAMKGLGF